MRIAGGVGRKGAPVRWATAGRMVAAWGLTLPAAAGVAAGAALLAQQGNAGVTAVAGPADIAAGQAAVKTVQVTDEVAGYIVDIARATRQSPSLSLGVSPRGATALLRSARAWA